MLKDKHRLVIKIGTSTLSFESGRLNFQRIEKLAHVLATLQKSGKDILLVTSGAIGVGAGRLGLGKKPQDLATKQALAAIGQAELMKIYQKFFGTYNQMVAQVLLTKDVMTDPVKNKNAKNTLKTLSEMDIIPIINENDTISTDEILFGDNDTLSATVAELVDADLLIMLSDIDGLYSADPKNNPDAKILSTVKEISPELESNAKGSKSSFGTGGMITKILAAKICSGAGIDAVLTNGNDPHILFDVIDGKEVGTLFISKKAMVSN
jgi:glutamate 5-kinase